MKILVTGATGFVGKECLKRLAGHEVVSAVRNPSELPNSVVIGEINGTTDWSAALQGVDAVLHVAGRAHMLQETATDPEAAFMATNRDGTLELAKQAAKAGIKRFVFVSSIGVNGFSQEVGQEGRGFSPKDQPAPYDPYTRSKHQAELSLAKIDGLEYVIVRPPLVFGPNAPGNIRVLMKAIWKGIPMPVKGIQNKRSMIGVTNLADFLVTCLEHENAVNRTFTIADDAVLTTAEILEDLSKGLSKPCKLVSFPSGILRAGLKALGKDKIHASLFRSLLIDSSEARNALNWKQPVDTATGLIATARAFRTEMGAR